MPKTITPAPLVAPIVTGYFRETPGYATWRPRGTEDFLLMLTISAIPAQFSVGQHLRWREDIACQQVIFEVRFAQHTLRLGDRRGGCLEAIRRHRVPGKLRVKVGFLLDQPGSQGYRLCLHRIEQALHLRSLVG